MPGPSPAPLYSTSPQAVWNRTKYCLDPEFRERKLQDNRTRRAAAGATGKRLKYLAARISFLRESIGRMQRTLERKDRELVELVTEREEIKARWKSSGPRK